jgi:hypothetical protein
LVDPNSTPSNDVQSSPHVHNTGDRCAVSGGNDDTMSAISFNEQERRPVSLALGEQIVPGLEAAAAKLFAKERSVAEMTVLLETDL